jgi:hypothetical protein
MPTTSAEAPQTMKAIASWVKWLAVPLATPGPCDAKAVVVQTAAMVEAGIAVKRDIRCLVRDEAMAISWDPIAEDTGDRPLKFRKVSNETPVRSGTYLRDMHSFQRRRHR